MIRPLALTLLLALAPPAGAQTDAVDLARRAAAQLEEAEASLRAAGGGRSRIAALTRTVRAYETGLAALRDGLRRASLREATLRARFEAERARIAQLLGVLQSIQSAPGPLSLLHPSGPIDTARSGMIVADVAPALQRQAEALRADLEEIALLRTLQDDALQALEDGLAGAQQARTALAQAISNRTDLPRRYLDDPGTAARLAESGATLDSFAASLAAMSERGAIPDAPDMAALKGTLPLPVEGIVLRRAGEADAAGIRRPGIVVGTRPRALVTTPLPGTVRYRGPLLDYGNVMVIEPAEGYLLVLAGLDQVYGAAGDVLPAGSPVGLMGGAAPDAESFLHRASQGGGDDRSETLYMELRQDGEPVDPADWFVLEQL